MKCPIILRMARLTNSEIKLLRSAVRNAMHSEDVEYLCKKNASAALCSLVRSKIPSIEAKVSAANLRSYVRSCLRLKPLGELHNLRSLAPKGKSAEDTKQMKVYWFNHHNKLLGTRVTHEKLMLQRTSSSKDIAFVLRKCMQGPALKYCRVLVLSALIHFDDANLETLLKLLAKNPQIFSVNLGEKERLSRDAWESFSEAIDSGRIGIRYCYTDSTFCPSDIKERVIAAMRKQRVLDCREERRSTSSLPAWKCPLVLEELLSENPSSERSNVDLAYGKPFYHRKIARK